MDENNSIMKCDKETFYTDSYKINNDSFIYEVIYKEYDKYIKIIFEVNKNNLKNINIKYKFTENNKGFIGQSNMSKIYQKNNSFFRVKINVIKTFGKKYNYLENLIDKVLILQNDSNNFIDYYSKFEINAELEVVNSLYLSDVKLGSFIDNKDIHIWNILPEITSYLRYIKSITDSKTLILFLARDCYLLEKIYKKIYPNDKNFKYVYCSRKLMYDSKNYDSYIKKVTGNYNKTLWIDIQGSGNSHMEYFMKRKKIIPKKLFLKKNKFTLKYDGYNSKNLQESYDKKYKKYISEFLHEDWTVNPGNNKDIYHYCFYLDSLFMAPYNSIIDLDNNFNPIFLNNRDMESKNREILIEQYDIISKDIFIDNINLYTNPYIFKNIEDINNNYNGLLIFDIDGTINHKKNKNVNKIINLAELKNLKIILCSARQNIFTNNEKIEKDYLKNIMKYNGFMKLKNKVDVWFNPFQKKSDLIQIANFKIKQIQFNLKNYNIKSEDTYYFDDSSINIEKAKEIGINTFLVDFNNGINDNQLNKFYSLF